MTTIRELQRRLDRIESGDGSNVHRYPVDGRTHDEKLIELRGRFGPHAQFALPRGGDDFGLFADVFV